jgi:hypothetical protein
VKKPARSTELMNDNQKTLLRMSNLVIRVDQVVGVQVHKPPRAIHHHPIMCFVKDCSMPK